MASAALFGGRRRWRLQLTAVQYGIIALLAPLEAHARGEDVGSALGFFEVVYPPVRHLAGLLRILRAGAVGSVEDRNALHLVAVVVGIGPGDSDADPRPVVVQGKGLRQILRAAAVRERGDVFRRGGADHDRRAVAPVDAAGERAPMGLAAGLHGNRRPSRRCLYGHALAADAIIGGTGILCMRRR